MSDDGGTPPRSPLGASMGSNWDPTDIDYDFEPEFDGPVIDFNVDASQVRKRISKNTQKAVLDNMYSWKNFKDKVVFTYGILIVACLGVLCRFEPRVLNAFYTIQLILFMAWRLFVYRAESYHYFMFDFCYFANLLMLLSMWIFPQNVLLFKVVFVYSLGPLVLAVAVWRNSLVLHSIDKLTSVYIHLAPPLCAVHMRWWEGGSLPNGSPIPADQREFTSSDMGYVMGGYLFWQLFYILRVHLIGRNKKLNYTYSSKYLFAKKNTMLYKVCRSFGPSLMEPMFMVVQFTYTLLTCLVPYFVWDIYPLASSIVGLSLTCAAWNGAVWYIDIFSLRYAAELDRNNRRLALFTNRMQDEDFRSKMEGKKKGNIDYTKLLQMWNAIQVPEVENVSDEEKESPVKAPKKEE